MSARLRAARAGARRALIWMAAIAGLLVTGVGGLNTAALAGTGGHADQPAAAPPAAATPAADRPADARPGLRSAGGPIVAFRIDVSHYPKVGVVVTVPGGQQGLTRRNFVVLTGAQSASPGVRQLSARNIQLVLAPDTALVPARRREEQAAAARFLVGLPDGAQTAVVDPAPPGALAHGLTRDATASVAGLAGLLPGTLGPAARLAAALSAFSPGARVRRTAVLVIASPSSLAAATAARFRRQLVASGTASMSSTPRSAEIVPMTLWPRSAGAGPSGCGRLLSGLARSAGSSVTSASSTTCALPIPIRCPGG